MNLAQEQAQLQQEVMIALQPLDLVNDPDFAQNEFRYHYGQEKVEEYIQLEEDNKGNKVPVPYQLFIVQIYIYKFISDTQMAQYFVPGKSGGKSRKVTNCHLKLSQNCDVYDADSKKLLFQLRKGVLKFSHQLNGCINKKIRPNNNRGPAAGPFDRNGKDFADRLVIKMVNQFEAMVTNAYDINQANLKPQSNPIYSTLIGYWEGGQHEGKEQHCRETEFTVKNPEFFREIKDAVGEVNHWFHRLQPVAHQTQCTILEPVSEFRIYNTAFTTITMNRDAVTSMHIDSSDLGDFSPIIAIGEFQGHMLLLPQYSAAIDIQPTDFALVNVHEIHCNLPGISLEKTITTSENIVATNNNNNNKPDDWYLKHGGKPVRHSFVFYAHKALLQRCQQDNQQKQAEKRQQFQQKGAALLSKQRAALVINNHINTNNSDDHINTHSKKRLLLLDSNDQSTRFNKIEEKENSNNKRSRCLS
jgi:hypothetical protein